MNHKLLTVLAVVIILLLVLSRKQIEKFTVKETDLASKIKVLLEKEGSYLDYVQVLVENDNVSSSLAKLATFTQLNRTSTVYDILSKM